jgi:hypothetical protein
VIHRRSLGNSLSLSLACSQSPCHTHRQFGSCRSVVRSLSFCLSLSLAQSPSHTHSRSLTASLSHSFSLAHSLPLTLSLSLSCSPETSPKAAYLRRKLPPRPVPDAQIRSEREKKKKLAGIRRISARFRRNPARYRRNHCQLGF